ncbi:MAG TPA: hypothetical protein VF135_12865 [Terriglobales bacterium]
MPGWLLHELFLLDGVFNDDRTIVTGRPNAHAGAVLNVGYGAPGRVSVDLTRRADWQSIRERLASEGF